MSKYYSLKNIKKKKAVYNLIFGERSNGKTYAVLEEVVKNWVHDRSQFAYVRRWKEDITGRRGSRVFSGLNENGAISKLTNGKYTTVYYIAGKFYLANYDEDTGKAIYSDEDILGYTFALSDGEHDKSTSFPLITVIMFDEFLTNKVYLQDEFIAFMNTVSTIVRRREDVTIYMLGNTVNKFCPYFKEMGLNHILKMEQGSIDIYKYGDSKLTVAVEYCSSMESKKENNFYFAFNNPKLEMITGGAWELSLYPHIPLKYKPKDVQLIYFIEFNDVLYQCEIVLVDDVTFTYIHLKTTDIKYPDKDIIYTLDYNPRMNYNRSIMNPINPIQQRIKWYFDSDRVYYSDNEVGDAIHNYLKVCKTL